MAPLFAALALTLSPYCPPRVFVAPAPVPMRMPAPQAQPFLWRMIRR